MWLTLGNVCDTLNKTLEKGGFVMATAYECAEYLIRDDGSEISNSKTCNMKLQKLLFFADLIHYVENGTPLFSDAILAFKNGCVVESVRKPFYTDYAPIRRGEKSIPRFSDSEKESLDLAIGIYGKASAKELSTLNHEFICWRTAYRAGLEPSGYHDQSKSVVDITLSQEQLDRIKTVVDLYRENQQSDDECISFNGVDFYYDKNFPMTDEVKQQLREYAYDAEDRAYSIYFDEGSLVIY